MSIPVCDPLWQVPQAHSTTQLIGPSKRNALPIKLRKDLVCQMHGGSQGHIIADHKLATKAKSAGR
jgi:hypothetical protein